MLEQTAKSRYRCWLCRSSDPASDSSIRPRGAAPANSAAIEYHGKARKTQRHLNRRLSSKRQGREASRWGVNGDRVYLKSESALHFKTHKWFLQSKSLSIIIKLKGLRGISACIQLLAVKMCFKSPYLIDERMLMQGRFYKQWNPPLFNISTHPSFLILHHCTVGYDSKLSQ